MATLTLSLTPINPTPGDPFTLSIIGATNATGKTITLGGISIAGWVVVEEQTSVEGVWGGVHLLASSNIPYLTPVTLSVVDGGDSGTLQVTTLPQIGYDSLIIAGIDADGIFQDDVGVAVGQELYGHITAGGPATVDNYGRVFGISPWRYEYYLRNLSTGWSGPATEQYGAIGGGGGTPGAAPTIAATAAWSKSATNLTSHSLTLATKVVGQRQLAVIAVDEAASVSWPAGWTVVGTSVEAGDIGFHAAMRVIDGTEGSTVDVSTGTAQQALGRVWALAGAGEISSVVSGGNVETTAVLTIDPVNITFPSGNYRIFAFAAWDQWKNSFTAYPAGYSDTGNDLSSQTNGAVCIAWGHKAVTGASSENPGAFTQDNSGDQCVALTIAIPAAITGTSIARKYMALRRSA